MKITHPKCGKTFPSNNTHGHCASCHETFVGLAAFDAHWVGTSADRHCENPAGLKGEWWTDDHGYWHRLVPNEVLRDFFRPGVWREISDLRTIDIFRDPATERSNRGCRCYTDHTAGCSLERYRSSSRTRRTRAP